MPWFWSASIDIDRHWAMIEGVLYVASLHHFNDSFGRVYGTGTRIYYTYLWCTLYICFCLLLAINPHYIHVYLFLNFGSWYNLASLCETKMKSDLNIDVLNAEWTKVSECWQRKKRQENLISLPIGNQKKNRYYHSLMHTLLKDLRLEKWLLLEHADVWEIGICAYYQINTLTPQ